MSARIRRLLAVGALVATSRVAAPELAHAHALAPSLLALEETAAGEVSVLWRTPLQAATQRSLRPRLPAGCSALGDAEVAVDPSRRSERLRLRCAGGLVGARVGVEGLEAAGTNVLLRVGLAEGRRFETLLSARSPAYEIPARQARGAVALAFVSLGVEHLATGIDHVLFVTGLVCLLRRGRRLLAAITAFTAGHSVTLALAVLGVVRVPSGLVEVGIAASLVLLAGELLRERAGRPPDLFVRRPWLMAFAFGLLHGLGFAGALTEAGLPAGEIPLALLSFNLGIELAQLLLVTLLLAGARALRPLPGRWRALAPRLAAEAIGILGVFFILTRMALVLGV